MGEDGVGADMTVMGDVRVGLKQVVVAESGDPAAALRAAVNGDEFPDEIAVADVCFGSFAVIFEILWSDADGGIGREGVVRADSDGAFDVDVGKEPGAGADFNVGADDAERADVRRFVHARGRIDDCRWMYRHGGLR